VKRPSLPFFRSAGLALTLGALALPASASATFTSLGKWSTTFTSPYAIAIAPSSSGAAQDVWISEDSSAPPGDDVQEFTPTGTHVLTIATPFTCQATQESFDFPDGVAVDPATGDVFVDDSGDSRVIEFNSAGSFLAQVGSGEVSMTCGVPASDSTGSGPGYFESGRGLSVGDGQLFVAQPGPDAGSPQPPVTGGNDYIEELPVPLSESHLESAEIGDGAFGQAVYDPDTGYVYAADSALNNFDVYTPAGATVTEWGPGFNGSDEFSGGNPQAAAIDPAAGVLYAVDTGNNRVIAFNIANGDYLQELAGLNDPVGVAVDPVSHVLYVVEQGSTDTVVRYSYTPAPACTPATATSNADAQVALPLSCTDQAGATVTYALDQRPAHGTASVNPTTGQASYTPASGYTGTDSFTYTASSIDGTSQPATVSVDMPAPSCAPESLSTSYEATLSLSLSCSGSSTAAAAYKIITQPAHGTLSTPGSTGTLAYTPNDAFAGTDSFTYAGVSASGQASAPVTVTVYVGATLPPPVAGQSANVYFASGTVTVTLPGQHTAIPLTAGMQVPLGSIINATDGRVGVFVESATGLQSADFYKGEFRLTQSASSHARRAGAAAADTWATLTLLGPKIRKTRCATYTTSFSGKFTLPPTDAPRNASHGKAKSFHEPGKPARQLWGDGHGNFTTVGMGSSSSVRGTIWAIFDYPDGTLTRVYTDSVSVYDIHLHRTVVVSAGHFYFAVLGKLRGCR
jgi:DNA-binding beta-propeller fold protein YncE